MYKVGDIIKLIIPKKPKPKYPYAKEFIVAMEELIQQYVEGEHTNNISKCPLCITARKVNIGKPFTCNICPWLIITGHTCMMYLPRNREQEIARIAELTKWIDIYKKSL